MRMKSLNLNTEHSNEQFIKSIEEQDYEVITRLLNAGTDVNYLRKDGMTSLIAAVAKGNISIVTQLLKQGCDVNLVPLLETNQYGDSALHVASIKGNLDMINLLLNNGVDVNVTSFGGRTPLMKACFYGNLEVAKELVAMGADVNQGDYQRMSAFLYSCSRGHKGISQYLLDNSADINAQNWKGETGLIISAQESHYGVMKLLLSTKCDVNIATEPVLQITNDMPSGSTALHFASHDGHVKMTRDLIRHGANINLQNDALLTPLHYSCSEGHNKITIILLTSDCEVDPQNDAGETALFKAVQGKYTNIVELLLKYKANPNISTDSEDTPLLKAISMNSPDLVKLLILANCDVKCCDTLFETHGDKKVGRTTRFNTESEEIMTILLLAGVGIHIVLKVASEKYSPTSQIKDIKEMEYPHPVEQQLISLWKQCFTLKQLCRVRIREIIGLNIQDKLDHLNLPALLKQYILLSELQ